MGFDLSSIGYNWEKLAQDDPLWAILTAKDKKGGRWTIEEFLATGTEDVGALATRCSELGLEFSGGKALDFGCGVGRLSSAMLASVERVIGLDISNTMLDIAKKLHGDKPIEFILNQRDDLSCFNDQDFDLVLSLITLQHMPPEYAEKYVLEFLRVLKPGGLLIFQLPGRSFTPESIMEPKGSLRKTVAKLLPGHFLEKFRYFKTSSPRMDMFGISPERIKSVVAMNHADIIAYDELEQIADGFPNFRYFIVKNELAG